MQTSFAVTYGAGDWATWLFLAFASGLASAFIARPQGMGCFGFGCFGNLLVGGIGAIIGNFIVGRFYSGEINVAVAFAISLLGALLVLYIGQGFDRLLRRNAPPDDEPPLPHTPPRIVDSTAREVTKDGEAMSNER
ncbi:MAG: GlsB/YeaQ/YmgE family stress response membrane protein [Chloroflexota bacterium]|nr:GlsB/YeaQ/YmgE family stress response membrane protein [Chloroflexota bacterium]MDQ6906890.1 GlsB/YeaQ/YmgE family stress response membrane protein [Chloroflexota bacterium]